MIYELLLYGMVQVCSIGCHFRWSYNCNYDEKHSRGSETRKREWSGQYCKLLLALRLRLRLILSVHIMSLPTSLLDTAGLTLDRMLCQGYFIPSRPTHH